MRRFMKLCAFLLAVVLAASALPAPGASAEALSPEDERFLWNSYFIVYLYNAYGSGFLPYTAKGEPIFDFDVDLDGNLVNDRPVSGMDFICLALDFYETKWRTSLSQELYASMDKGLTEMEARAAAFRRLFPDARLSQMPAAQLDGRMAMDDVISNLVEVMRQLVAPFSPLYFYNYFANNQELIVPFFKFENDAYAVYHPESLKVLLGDVIGKSMGMERTEIKSDTPISRAQLLAFMYRFSQACLAKDPGGRYPESAAIINYYNATTDVYVDKALAGAGLKDGMSQRERLKAIYDYLIYNYRHFDDKEAILLDPKDEKRHDPLDSDIKFAAPLFEDGYGVCDNFANAFRLLALRLGIECNTVSGYYVNRNGSRSGHVWNQVKLDGEWFWLDVDVERQVLQRGGAKQPSYFLFLKKDAEWINNHSWDRGAWPAADGVKRPPAVPPLPDVPSPWARQAVADATAAGLVPQALQRNYARPVTRGDMAQLLINLIEKSSGKKIDAFLAAKGASIAASAFTDTTDRAVLAAHALGIINSGEDGRFNPGGTFTRAQIAAVINRTAQALGVDTAGYPHPFTDVKGHWADSELGWPAHAGIITSVGDGRFDPDGPLTTEQSIAIAFRALQNLKNNLKKQ